jgi:hypothetical protein
MKTLCPICGCKSVSAEEAEAHRRLLCSASREFYDRYKGDFLRFAKEQPQLYVQYMRGKLEFKEFLYNIAFGSGKKVWRDVQTA